MRYIYQFDPKCSTAPTSLEPRLSGRRKNQLLSNGLNAENTYQQARIARVQAEAARYADAAALFQALGGGWWNRSDVAPETQSEGLFSPKSFFVP